MPSPSLADDGLHTPAVGPWSEQKYRLISNYAQMFATSMKKKWSRVYIDLFAGAGRARIRETERIVSTSTLLALAVRDPFDRYIFCDIDSTCVAALRDRVERDYPGRDVRILEGDSNDLAAQVVAELPPRVGGRGVLSFCVLDPFNLKNLRFETVEQLMRGRMDFLVLISSYMDAHRNEGVYSEPGNNVVADFLGNPLWKDLRAETTGDFGHFIVDQFGRSMRERGFLYGGPDETVAISSKDGGRPIYHLGFFSQHELGKKFWREARKSSNPQMNLPF